MSTLRLHLFGPPRLERDGSPLHIQRRHTLALILYLALTGEIHHRESMLGLLWPDDDPSRARANLRRTIYYANQSLGEGWLVATAETVGFHPQAAFWLDVAQFRTHLAVCTQHSHPPEQICAHCLSLLEEAVALYQSDFLAGFSLADSPAFDEWQLFEGEALRAELASALERLVTGYAEQHAYAQAIAHARRWLALDALHEPAHRWLMQLYAVSDQQAAALRQYELCAQLLADELGVQPAPETEQLAQAIHERRLTPLLHKPTPPPPDRSAQPDDIRIVTAVSVGLAGPDRPGLSLDQIAADTARLLAIAQDTGTLFGGRFEAVAGEDGLILYGVDRVHEDDAERGVRTGLAIQAAAQNAGLAVRIGISTGMAYCRRTGAVAAVTGPAVIGPGVNLAVRLRDQAPPGQILVSRECYRTTSGVCVYAPVTVELPGTTTATPAYRLLGLHSVQRKIRRTAAKSAELIGREGELAQLRASLRQAQNGEGQIVALVGEAGIGKSRLIAELHAGSQGEEVLWLEGRGQEMAGAVGYWLFTDLLRSYCVPANRDASDNLLASRLATLTANGGLSSTARAEISPLLERLLASSLSAPAEQVEAIRPEQLHRRMAQAVGDFVVALAHSQTTVLVLEDLHWADALSLELIESLLVRLNGQRLLLLCVYRPEGTQASAALAHTARRLCAERFAELQLSELTQPQSQQLLTALWDGAHLAEEARTQLLNRAQGNPFFLEELVRGLLETDASNSPPERQETGADEAARVPESLQSLILSRLDRLPPPQRTLLQNASILGRLFRPEVVEQMHHPDPALGRHLAELTERGFVYLDRTFPADEYAFRHVLMRDAIYQDLPGQRRASLQASAGAAMERLYAANRDPHLESLAYHYAASQDDAKAIQYLLLAGQKAQSLYANQEALHFFAQAQTRAEQMPPDQRNPRWQLAALRGRGEVYATLGDLEMAEPALRQAIDLAQALALPVNEQVQPYFPLCHLYRWLGRFEDLFQLGQKGLLLLGDDTQSAEAAILISYLALGAYLTGRRHQYRALAALIVDTVRSLPYSQNLMSAYNIASLWYRDARRVAEASTWLDSLIAEALARNDLWTLGYLRASPGFWLNEAVGDLTTILANQRALLANAEKTGDQLQQGYALTYLGLLAWLQGDLDELERMQREALAIHRQSQSLHQCVQNISAIGFAHLCRQEWAKAAARLEEGLALAARIGYRIHIVQMARMSLAYAYRMQGRVPEAAALYRTVAIQEETDGDGQAWTAFALAGLEQTLDDPLTFQAECRAIAAARPASDPLPLVQWYLQPAQPVDELPTITFSPTLEDSLPADWSWYDLFGDCALRRDEDGIVIHAAHYYRDLWFNNTSAPRLMTPARGNFALEVVCSPGLADYPAMGGIVLWKDRQNFLRLGWGAHGLHSLDLMGCLHNQDRLWGRGLLPGALRIHLRLERVAERVTGLCSADGVRWFSVGSVEFPVDDPLEVGLFATGMIQRWAYPGTYPKGTAIRFHWKKQQSSTLKTLPALL